MMSQTIIQSNEQIDYYYLEEIIQKCSVPLPDPFFSTMGFVTQFLYQCDEMCKLLSHSSQPGNILSSEPRLLRLRSPAYVFGDFHGNMTDLLTFAKTMWPLGMHLTPGTFLFLGDYVDRGMFGLELLAYLFAQKIMLPEKVYLLRGNHEVKAVNVLNSAHLSPRDVTVFTAPNAFWDSFVLGFQKRSLLRSGIVQTRSSIISRWQPPSMMSFSVFMEAFLDRWKDSNARRSTLLT